jgi:hypothetical protein
MSPGAILVISTESLRFTRFVGQLTACLQGPDAPIGSALFWHQGVDIPASMNHGVRRMLANPTLRWLWIMGDDHTFAPDILKRLLAHNVSVVAPLVLKRCQPYHTVAVNFDGSPRSFRADEHGLVEVAATGSGGMLIRRGVFEDLPDPWFVHGGKERSGEDLAFCETLSRKGIPRFVDLDTPMGHITPMEVWPVRREADGAWGVKILNHLTMEVL